MKCCEENIFKPLIKCKKPLIKCKKPTNPIVSVTVFDSKFWRVKNGKLVIRL